jgi:site-specific DNA-methyltransferase (adenine-specific)
MTLIPTLNETVTLHHGDSLDVLKTIPDSTVDSVVTDPPYELGFMGKGWDATGIAYSVELWAECLRVLKPGGHLLSFGGTRTYHRMTVAIEDAGFEIRDSIHWTYGTGFPKSLDVSKAIDKRSGALQNEGVGFTVAGYSHNDKLLTTAPSRGYVPPAPATPEAQQWSGWGTALKPSHEPIVVARKPINTTVAENVLTHGTGALNIDGCRVGTSKPPTTHNDAKYQGMNIAEDGRKTVSSVHSGGDERTNVGRFPANTILGHSADCQRVGDKPSHEPIVVARKPINTTVAENVLTHGTGALNIDGCRIAGEVPQVTQGLSSTPSSWEHRKEPRLSQPNTAGRWPANTILGHSVDCEHETLSATSPVFTCVQGCPVLALNEQSDSSRFFQNVEWSADTDDLGNLVYQAKAGKKERPVVNGVAHATVKPLALMRYLVRLVTPDGGTVLEPFAGSGTTVEACIQEGFHCIAIDLEASHIPLIQARINRNNT